LTLPATAEPVDRSIPSLEFLNSSNSLLAESSLTYCDYLENRIGEERFLQRIGAKRC
jgi:hypothetical protein